VRGPYLKLAGAGGVGREYREGTVKSTPVRGVKEILKPLTCKQSEAIA